MHSVSLHIDGLTIRYPNGKTAVRDLSLEVKPGEVFGLVGPNGAGKSTLLKCVAGLIPALSGTLRCGEKVLRGNAAEAARCVALMPDPLGVYNDLNGREYLEFFARAFGLPAGDRPRRIAAAVERLGLGPWLDHEVESLSSGWQRRLALGRVLLSDAPILLLDEPAAGLDVAARIELLAVVRSLAFEGRTLLVTSHILPELEELADRFGILQDGTWTPFAEDRTFFTAADMRSNFGAPRCRLACALPERARDTLLPHHPDVAITADGAALSFAAPDREAIAHAISLLAANGIAIYEARTESHSLSTVAARLLKPSA